MWVFHWLVCVYKSLGVRADLLLDLSCSFCLFLHQTCPAGSSQTSWLRIVLRLSAAWLVLWAASAAPRPAPARSNENMKKMLLRMNPNPEKFRNTTSRLRRTRKMNQKEKEYENPFNKGVLHRPCPVFCAWIRHRNQIWFNEIQRMPQLLMLSDYKWTYTSWYMHQQPVNITNITCSVI